MDFRTILMKAACYDQIDVVKFLITNTNARLFSDIETNPSALCLAILKNHTKLANHLQNFFVMHIQELEVRLIRS